MRHLLITILIIASLLLMQCNTKTKNGGRPEFSVEVRHFGAAAGLTLYYIVNDESIQVDTDCDFAGCTRKTLYKRELSTDQSNQLHEDLQSLRVDTLKKNYEPEFTVLDGLVSSIKIRGSGLPGKKISIDNVSIPAIDSLYRVIDKLILTKEYQFYHFGQE